MTERLKNKPTGVHLVGSVPLATSAEVFDQVCAAVGPQLARLPDGETGARKGWIGFQHEMLRNHPAVSINPAGRTVPIRDLEGKISRENALFVLNPEMPLTEINFRPLGYVEPAIESWKIFQQKQAHGIIPAGVRFQVCLPTPLATGLLYFHPDAQEAFIGLMKEALLGELREICAAIPHDRLAIQWDCCQEILLLEGYFPDDWVYNRDNLMPIVAALGDAVPADVELGYHFCYGSPVDSPLVKQKDMGVVVNFCNQLAAQLAHSLDFAHLPVSAPSAGPDFFRPLADLAVADSTQIYLGILHPKVPGGDATRIAAAQQYLPSFGIATECGWGRKSAESVGQVLQVHIDATTE